MREDELKKFIKKVENVLRNDKRWEENGDNLLKKKFKKISKKNPDPLTNFYIGPTVFDDVIYQHKPPQYYNKNIQLPEKQHVEKNTTSDIKNLNNNYINNLKNFGKKMDEIETKLSKISG